MTPTITIDSREPNPHPWLRHWPSVHIETAALETGDLCLAGNPLVVVERKTVSDFLACIGGERERFERELRRSRYLDSFAIVIEGTLLDLTRKSRGLHPNSILGTCAAWIRRGYPIVFCGSERLAAEFSLRYLTQPVNEARRLLDAIERNEAASKL